MVKLSNGDKQIAEFRLEGARREPKWYVLESASPTEEKKAVLCPNVREWTKASKSDVAKARARLLTEAERIEKAFEGHCSTWGRIGANPQFPVPAHRVLRPGNVVSVGNLEDCVVLECRFDNTWVCVKHRPIQSNDSASGDLSYPDAISIFHWTSVLWKAELNKYPAVAKKNKIAGLYRNAGLYSLALRLIEGAYIPNPLYQRDYVWTAADQERYLSALFEGRPSGSIILVRNPYPAKTEILDGLQRLTTLAYFITGHISYKGMQYYELAMSDINQLDSYCIPVAELQSTEFSKAELLAIFLDENEGGVPQTAEHLASVRARYKEMLEKGQ